MSSLEIPEVADTAVPYQRILGVIDQPVYVSDNDGRVLYANAAAAAALGYQSTFDMIGLNSHAAWHHSHPDGSPYPVEDCPMVLPRTTGLAQHSEEEWFVRYDGTFMPVAWSSTPIEVRGRLGAAFAFRDLTDRRAQEQFARERDAADIRAQEAHAAQRRILESVTESRRALARDLHDGAQQQLVNLLLTLQMTRAGVPDGSTVAVGLDDAITAASTAISDLRELAAGVHPAVLTSRGLVPALRSLVARTRLPVDVGVDLTERPDAAVEASAYFIAAEALTNVTKHAHATQAHIAVAREGDDLVLSISDDGVGGAESGGGSGLIGIEDRANALGGTLTLTSPIEEGTRLEVRLPFQLP